MTLSEHQRKFAQLVGKLIDWAYANGYELTFGEAWRSDEEAKIQADKGAGIVNSLHRLRCAVDLNVFKDGAFQTDIEAYRPLGEYWKTLDPDCAWGGDFSRPDSDHFSLAWQGVR